MLSHDIIQAIEEELSYQDMLWGPTGCKGDHTLTEWLAYIRSYTNEGLEKMCRIADEECKEPTRHIMRKIAALAIRAMMQHGVEYRQPADRNELHMAVRRATGE